MATAYPYFQNRSMYGFSFALTIWNSIFAGCLGRLSKWLTVNTPMIWHSIQVFNSVVGFVLVRHTLVGCCDNHNNQPPNQPTNLPTYLPTNQPSKQPTNQPTHRPTDRPTNQPTNSLQVFPAWHLISIIHGFLMLKFMPLPLSFQAALRCELWGWGVGSSYAMWMFPKTVCFYPQIIPF